MRTRDYAPRFFPALHRSLPPSLATYSNRRARTEMTDSPNDVADAAPHIAVEASAASSGATPATSDANRGAEDDATPSIATI